MTLRVWLMYCAMMLPSSPTSGPSPESGLDEVDQLVNALNQGPWYRQLRRSTARAAASLRRSPRTMWNSLRWCRQRLSRGWDDRALFHLDSHLAWTLGAQLEALADRTQSRPENYGGGREGWLADLRRHGGALAVYGSIDNLLPSHYRICEDARAALHWVAENLESLWD